MSFPDFRPAPNQGGRPDLYELENRAVDPDGLVLAEMRRLAPWAGLTLVDLGCGSGYWLPGYAAEASEVIGVEPDLALLEAARARDRRARVLAGSAEHIPLADASVDVVHARFAYFWPPRGAGQGRADVTDAWWAARGAVRAEVMSRWGFGSRGDFAAVLGLEFPAEVAWSWLADHPGQRGLSYGYVLFAVRRG